VLLHGRHGVLLARLTLLVFCPHLVGCFFTLMQATAPRMAVDPELRQAATEAAVTSPETAFKRRLLSFELGGVSTFEVAGMRIRQPLRKSNWALVGGALERRGRESFCYSVEAGAMRKNVCCQLTYRYLTVPVDTDTELGRELERRTLYCDEESPLWRFPWIDGKRVARLEPGQEPPRWLLRLDGPGAPPGRLDVDGQAYRVMPVKQVIRMANGQSSPPIPIGYRLQDPAGRDAAAVQIFGLPTVWVRRQEPHAPELARAAAALLVYASR
jgi:hypothetical protein